MMRLRRFNDRGIRDFRDFLDRVENGRIDRESGAELLRSAGSSQIVEPEIALEGRAFATRFDLAEYLHLHLSPLAAGVERDRGLWAWLALFLFDQLCPTGAGGKRNLGERARWIPAVGNFRRYYRHLVAGPFGVFRAHQDDPERARVLLCTPPHRPGELVEQLTSRQEFVRSKSIVAVAGRLYLARESGKVKRGAAGRGAGSARRLADVLNQLDVVWDLHALGPDDIVGMLPTEFDRFRMP